MEYFAASVPKSESELVVLISILNAYEIPHYVQNRGFGSLYPGMQIPIYNIQRIMVPLAYAEEAIALLSEYRKEETANSTEEKLRWSDRLRIAIELLLGGWSFPVRHRSFGRRDENDEESA